MDWLCDTNLLIRGLHRTDPRHSQVRDALRILVSRQDRLCYTLQGLTEFWNVCTRPATARGGLGLSVAEVDRRVRLIERHLTFLPDTFDVRSHWRKLVVQHNIQGVQVHDARLVASMMGHGITHVLTFNGSDFGRYPNIVAVDPLDVIAGKF